MVGKVELGVSCRLRRWFVLKIAAGEREAKVKRVRCEAST